MMTRIEKKFGQLQDENKKAFIPYIMAGDPNLETTYRLVLSMAEKGGDIIELGIPYSDPLADGPVNQRAASRALQQGIRIKDIMDLVKRIREVSQVPIAYLVYFNCMLQYGLERFLGECEEVGVDGLVIPDLPYEEKKQFAEVFEAYSVNIITLVAPTSQERIERIVEDAKGFIYCITSMGVTGVRRDFQSDITGLVSEIAKYSDTPRVLGFGISTPEQVARLKGTAEGLIVGSAIVKLAEECKTEDETVERVGEFVKELKAAMSS